MCVGGVRGVVGIPVCGAVAEGAVRQVAFYTSASRAEGRGQIPAPCAADEVECPAGLVYCEVPLDFEGLPEPDEVVGELGGRRANGDPGLC